MTASKLLPSAQHLSPAYARMDVAARSLLQKLESTDQHDARALAGELGLEKSDVFEMQSDGCDRLRAMYLRQREGIRVADGSPSDRDSRPDQVASESSYNYAGNKYVECSRREMTPDGVGQLAWTSSEKLAEPRLRQWQVFTDGPEGFLRVTFTTPQEGQSGLGVLISKMDDGAGFDMFGRLPLQA